MHDVPGMPHVCGSPAVGVSEHATAKLQAATRPSILELEVHHARNGVRAVLRRSAVAQHLDLLHGNRRDDREVRPLRAVRNAVPEPGDDRGAVAPLPVEQDQRVIRSQVAQVSGPDDRSRVADGLNVHVVGRHDISNQARHVGVPLTHNLPSGDDIDGDRRLCDGPGPRTRSHDDQAFQLQCHLGERHVELGGLSIGDGDRPALRLVANQHEHHLMRASGYVSDLVASVVTSVDAHREFRKADLRYRQAGARARVRNSALECALRRCRPGVDKCEPSDEYY